MNDRRTKQMLMCIFCIIVSAVGIYFTFWVKEDRRTDSKNEKQKTSEKKEEFDKYNYQNQELPNIDNESNEISEGYEVVIYFTNTDKLDKSGLSLNAQGELCRKTQEFLRLSGYEGVEELKIQDEKFIDDKNKTLFLCDIPGYDEKLQITYLKKESKLKFAVVVIENVQS